LLDNMDLSSDARADSPRSLALVITELEPGGAERCLVELATRLDRSRFAPVVYVLQALPESSALVNRLIEAEIPVDVLALQYSWEYFRGVRQLAALLRQARTEIVQTFLFHANVVGARAARLAGVQHVVTGIRVADPRRWRTTIERVATARADRHVCVSQSVAEFCRWRGFAAEKLVVIPNGIDVARWRDAKPANLEPLGVPTGRRLLLYVGRLDHQKGLDRFFRELPVIFRELPEHDLALVGEGKLKAALKRLAGRLEIAARVHFLGWQGDVPSIVAAADLLVLPSRWEGMPNVVLEAMAAGKPVIATQAEGTVELLGLAALQQTVSVGDWAGLRSLVVRIARNSSLAQSVGQRNQERAQQFSLEFLAERYQRLYESLSR